MDKRRRPTYYEVFSLQDGTVILSRPIRKPGKGYIKDYRIKFDEDGVATEYMLKGKSWESSGDVDYRHRTQMLISARLNARRAIRELMLPRIAALDEQLASLRTQLDRTERRLAGK